MTQGPSIVNADPRASAPEGERHFDTKVRVLGTLSAHFRRTGRRVYLSSDLGICYPGEPIFTPDLIAVRDVEPGERTSWVVSNEGRGLDLAMEFPVGRKPRQDFTDNAVRFAALGIPEYFAFDIAKAHLVGWRLPSPSARSYEPIPSLGGRLCSAVLGLELCVENHRLRFLVGWSPLPDPAELMVRLSRGIDEAIQRAEEQAQRADRLADKLRALGIDPETIE